ncbi:6-phosphogluconolactonase (cycloisomerase 2 family) [Haloactinospora alba]|uniref:6-phosphogluconolactonase (Cycloisomerase 2 family) n=1 Tax=Haloactinospora alba TaxID=405555 RepID=A0A543NKZ0_9ACTN|nr:lactonase family protein [Haloactinospora alba]TQN32479.1 6-phosphogluconolactonase (cycloisomerase 2 family) [Haloactinospora alba]
MTHQLLWVGTYTPGSDPPGSGAGVHRVWLDHSSGELSGGEAAAATTGPSYLAAHPTRPLLYSVNECTTGRVTGFAVREGGELTELADASTGGCAPCHLTVHPDGRHVSVANYADGTVSVHPVGADGAPLPPVRVLPHTGSGPDERQQGPHAHHVRVPRGGGELLVADLGTDELRRHPLTADARPDGGPVAARFPPGSGPRHVVSHPDGGLCVVGELDSRIHVLRWEPCGTALRWETAVAATERTGENHPAAVVRPEGGRRLYVSNRGAGTVSAFELPARGAPPRFLAETPSGGTWPRHVALAGRYLVAANQDTGLLAVLALDDETGVPVDTGNRMQLGSPACVLPA